MRIQEFIVSYGRSCVLYSEFQSSLDYSNELQGFVVVVAGSVVHETEGNFCFNKLLRK